MSLLTLSAVKRRCGAMVGSTRGSAVKGINCICIPTSPAPPRAYCGAFRPTLHFLWKLVACVWPRSANSSCASLLCTPARFEMDTAEVFKHIEEKLGTLSPDDALKFRLQGVGIAVGAAAAFVIVRANVSVQGLCWVDGALLLVAHGWGLLQFRNMWNKLVGLKVPVPHTLKLRSLECVA